ncbi:MAG: exodeoxyribonuclease V subunit gamma [Desulfobulbaceae bacterium]|jgi:exodeoxyribonuclease V gamma subunit|nr:exodeoxyribonuclease V subunit gamma [Desulfobulbaceae bacterium]
MFCLHLSNRGENLLSHLAAVFEADDKREPLRPELFLVHSQGTELMIRQFLADKFLSWGNYRFLYPMNLAEHLAACLGMPLDAAAFGRGRLAWRLESLLRHAGIPVLDAFLAEEPVALKRYQLARQLAALFDRYQLLRPDMLAAWQAGRTATKNPHEKWQAELWRRLRAQTPETPHRGEVLLRLAERLAERRQQLEASFALPQRLSVFGLHSMPPLLLHCLNALSGHADVHLYLLSPCRNYWLDARRSARQASQSAQLDPPLLESGDEYHPLLTAFAQEGRDFQALLAETVNPDLHPTSYHFPLADGKGSLLHQLQADILDGQRPRPGSRAFVKDDSVKVAACFSHRREVEVVKDHILDFLEKNSDLQPRDIIVMAPDIGQYAPFIPAIFQDIPHSIADRSLGRGNLALVIFLDFLRLLPGRCGWTAILDLLAREPLATCWGLTPSDLDGLRQWTPDSGIRWGLNSKHLTAFTAPDDLTTSWEAGLKRMTLGFAMGDGPPFHGIIPWDGIEGGDGRLLGRLHAFIALIRETLLEFAEDCPLSGWRNRLTTLMVRLFPRLDEGDDAREGLAGLRQVLAGLAAIPANEHQEPVSLAVITNWLRRQAETPAAGGFLRGRLTFCSMLPMRSIPFAGIFLLGLNDGDFPRRDTTVSFDLLRESFRLGDRSAHADDRYQFFEAILSARRALFLSYVGKSAKKGDDMPPSLVVTEFLETLADDYGVRDLVTEHPLHPFDRRYFSGENSDLFTYAAELAPQKNQTEGEKKTPWWRGEIAFAPQTIALSDWLQFAAHPQRHFFQRRLGIDLRQAVDQIPEHENFTLDALENWHADHEIIHAIAAGRSKEETMVKLAASGYWPQGGPGQALFQEKWRAMTELTATVTDLDLGQPLPARFFTVDCGPFHCQGMLAHGHERGLLLANRRRLKGKDLLQGWLYALLLRHLPEAPQEVILACADGVFRLRADDVAPSLKDMANLFINGSRAPAPLLVEPAFVWAKQEASSSPRKTLTGNDKAEQTLQEALKDGHEPEWEKLFAHAAPPLWQAEHEEAARMFMLPIYFRLKTA